MKNILKLILLFSLTFFSLHAQGEATCYALTDNSKKLYKVTMHANMDPLPIATTIDISHSFNGEGSAYLARNNTFYAFSGISDDIGPSNLYKINVDTGEVALVKSLLIPTINGTVEGAEFYFNPTLNREILYVISQENNSKLYAFDPDNNWKLLNGYPKNTYTDLSSLAIDPLTGKGYAIDDYNYDNKKPKVYALNLETGATTHITTLQHLADAEGLAFASDGNLYIEDEGRDDLNGKKLYMIDLTTGALTPAAITNANGDIEGLSCNGTAMKVSYDFGDAPDEYTHVSHKISENLYLGNNKPDAEDDQQSSADATGDGADDNDAVINLPTLNIGDSSYTVPIKVYNNTEKTAYITAWIDFNRNGIFEYDEALNTNDLKIYSSPLTQTGNIVWDSSFSPKMNNLTAGKTIMRIRLSTSRILRCDDPHYKEGQNYGDNYFISPDGEVEDYEIKITDSSKALKGQFNVERINSNNYPINTIERNAWYTQIVGRDFDYSVLFYNEEFNAEKNISNTTVKIELIDQDTNKTLYERYAYIPKNPQESRIDVTLPAEDLVNVPATKRAIFRVSYGVDENDTIVQADCNIDDVETCYKKNINIKTDYARDNFSIRPEMIYVTIADKNQSILNSKVDKNISLAAGYKDYNLTVTATQYSADTPAKGYSKLADSSIEMNSTGLTCQDTSPIDEPIYFKDGLFQDLSFSHNNVGTYLLKIEDDKEWTRVDQNSTILGCIPNSGERVANAEGKVGCDIVVDKFDTELIFQPDHFSVNLNMQNLPNSGHPDFIYMMELNATNNNVAIQFDGNITAQSEDNITTTNFTAGCVATNLLLDLNATTVSVDGVDKNITTSDNITPVNFSRVIRFNNETNTSKFDVNRTLRRIGKILPIDSSRFLNENNGSMSLDMRYNLNKNIKQPINPVEVTFNSIDVNSPDANSSAYQITNHIPKGSSTFPDNVKNFYFARVVSDLNNYPRVNMHISPLVRTPLNVDIYCGTSLDNYCIDRKVIANSNISGTVREQNGYYVSFKHNGELDGNVTGLTDNPNMVTISPDPNNDISLDNGSNGTVNEVFINCNNPSSTITIQTDPVLAFEPSEYTVNCTDANASQWTGIGKTGNVLEVHPKVNNSRKMDW